MGLWKSTVEPVIPYWVRSKLAIGVKSIKRVYISVVVGRAASWWQTAAAAVSGGWWPAARVAVRARHTVFR